MNRAQLTLIVVVIVLALQGSVSLGAQSSLQEEFLSNAPAGWSKLKESLSRVKGEATVESYSGKTKKKESRIEFSVRDDSQSCISTFPDSKKTQAICRSSFHNYTFALSQTDPNNGYSVARLDDYQVFVPFAYSPAQEITYRSLLQYLHSALTVKGYSLPDMVGHVGFVIKSVTAHGSDSDKIDVHFDFESPVPKQMSSLSNAHAILSKKNHWAMIEFTAEVSWGGISSKTEFDAEGSNFLPSTTVIELWDGKPGESTLGTNSHCKFTDIQSYNASKEEFSLAAFGLPEVQHGNTRKTFSSIVFGTLAVLTFVGFLYLRRSNK